MGDLNEAENGREGTNRRICAAGFVNVFQSQLDVKLPPTRINGSEGIHQAWATPSMLRIIKYAGYLPFGNGMSDSHRAMFIDFQIQYIQRERDNNFKHRNLRSTHPHKAKIYIKIVVEQTNKFNILERLNELSKKVKNTKTKKIQASLSELWKQLIHW